MIACRFADTPEEKARKLAKKAAMPPSKISSFDILQSLAGAYPLSLDGMQPGLPAGFTSFSAAGIPDTNGELLKTSATPHEAVTCCQPQHRFNKSSRGVANMSYIKHAKTNAVLEVFLRNVSRQVCYCVNVHDSYCQQGTDKALTVSRGPPDAHDHTRT